MKTFVFDADGVVCVGSSFSMALEREHRISRERLAPFFAGPFTECILGLRDLKAELALHIGDWGWRGSVDELLAFWFRSEHVVCSQLLSCVRALRQMGHGCVLGTNQEKYRAEYLRREMRLAEEFDHVLPSCELRAAKPSGAFFHAVQERLRQAPNALCLIDDSERNVAGARAAGWRAIWYRGTADISAIKAEAGEVAV